SPFPVEESNLVISTKLLLVNHTSNVSGGNDNILFDAFQVLEACMNNCGKRFRSEAAKFCFLNELIKVLMPKVTHRPQKVKDRVTEVFYGWTLWLKEEPKIQEAYNMLKKQGIVKKDPTLPDTVVLAPPPQRTTESMLVRLLRSGHPEDLETANRLIKSTIQEARSLIFLEQNFIYGNFYNKTEIFTSSINIR
uniref:Golgi-associated, gamma adaptin ear containing, ARF binding protein 2 n=1 Tax=Nothobranchius furzeri TaxID=105023 RepID=A0A8C6LM45_NOTFU